MRDRLIEQARRLAFHYVGTFYIWGGDDPAGFDCSGFCIELLSSVGIVPSGTWDTTADGLMRQHWPESQPKRGCLMFWGTPEKATHVEFVYDVIGDVVLTIGASGGTSRTRTIDDARRDNAFIKMRPARKNPIKVLDPFA